MKKEELIKEISKFLEENPFSEEEEKEWKEKMPKMNEVDLQSLFDLLKTKLQIIVDTNQKLIDMAENLLEESDKIKPDNKNSIVDLKIEDLGKKFNKELTPLLLDNNFDIFEQLDSYFMLSSLYQEDVVRQFDYLIQAIKNNNEIIFAKTKISIKTWLDSYDSFQPKREHRKSIDRISFVNQSSEAQKLNKTERRILLKLLKLYDFLLNPENVNLGVSEKNIVSLPKTLSGTPLQRPRDMDNFKKLLEKYPPGSLERKAIEEEMKRIEGGK